MITAKTSSHRHREPGARGEFPRPEDQNARSGVRHRDGSHADVLRQPERPSAEFRAGPIAPPELVQIHKLPGSGAVIRIQVNDLGYLDTPHMRPVIDRLLDIGMDTDYGDIVLDLSDMKYITAHFLNVLVCFWRWLRHQKRHLMLCGVHPHCAYILRLGGIDRLIHCHPAPRGRPDDESDGDSAGRREFASPTAHDHEWRVALESA